MKILSPSEAGYVAGMVDGEFSVAIQRRTEETRVTPSFLVNIQLGITDLRVIGFIHSLIPDATVYRIKRPTGLPYYRLTVNQADKRSFFTQLIPYLQGKRRQAELCLEMMDLRAQYAPNRSHPNARCWQPINPEFLEKAERIFAEFRSFQLIRQPFAGRPRGPNKKKNPQVTLEESTRLIEAGWVGPEERVQ